MCIALGKRYARDYHINRLTARWFDPSLHVLKALLENPDACFLNKTRADQTEEFLSFRQLAANALDLKLLMNAINVKKKNRAHEPPNRLAEGEQRFPAFLRLQKGWQE